jgi:1,4-dihydroxy-2-naphthoyl-CoA hydrolase
MSTAQDDPAAAFHAAMPFARTLPVEVLAYTPAEVLARLSWSEDLCTSDGLMQDGAIMALADSTGAGCAFLNLPEGASGTTTVEAKTNFFRGVRDGHVEARSRPLHAGRTLVVIDTEVVNDRRALVARVTQTQLVLTR